MGLHRTAFSPLRCAKAAVYAGVSWSGFAPFGWFGANGLGRRLVASRELRCFAKARKFGVLLAAQLVAGVGLKIGVGRVGSSTKKRI